MNTTAPQDLSETLYVFQRPAGDHASVLVLFCFLVRNELSLARRSVFLEAVTSAVR